ncbi:MAG: Ig domain-containing protein [ANME-2 cluster archaeon]|nr:Ig domain-containing protein [ANME-2 cluster archaeon]
MTVTLTTSTHAENVSYTITINNVRDRASTPNTMAPAEVTYKFINELTITNITAASGKNYVFDLLDTGKLQYIDRSYTFSSVPYSYAGLKYIKTANDDKASTVDSFLEFDVNRDVTVYVAHDDRLSPKPSWLAFFTDTGDNIASEGGTFSLYARDFSAGHISLGGNYGDTYSMYNVVLEPLTDSPINNPPQLAAIGDQIIEEGQTLTFTIFATDLNGDVLTYSDTNLPTGATFNSATRTFSWTPDENQAGSYQVHFEVTDGSLIDAEDVTITVNGAAVEVTLTLNEGWNLIALPVINDSFTANSLASAIGDVSYVMKRNASDGCYQDYIVGFSGDADDFVISPDKGYYVYLDVVQT